MTSRTSVYDDALLGILQNEGQIAPFLDAIFAFLYRRTDFFQPLAEDGKVGFPAGIAHKLIEDSFRKYHHLTESQRQNSVAEVRLIESPVSSCETTSMASPETGERRAIPIITAQHADDPGNGAVHDKFAWNQTNHDLDVRVYVSKSITKSKQLQVDLTKTGMKIALKGATENDTILEGTFRRPINSAESMWIFVPGEYVQMTLEKDEDGWWDCLLEGEDTINLSKIDAEISFTDIGTEEQQQIRKMIHDQKMVTKGKSTSDQAKLAAVLKQAWNVERSPFNGQPYDPSIIPNTN